MEKKKNVRINSHKFCVGFHGLVKSCRPVMPASRVNLIHVGDKNFFFSFFLSFLFLLYDLTESISQIIKYQQKNKQKQNKKKWSSAFRLG